MVRLSFKRCFIVLLTSAVFTFLVLFLYFIFESSRFQSKTSEKLQDNNILLKIDQIDEDLNLKAFSNLGMSLPVESIKVEPDSSASSIHAFYYGWYGNIETDDYYYHWKHRILPHWTKKISDMYATGEKHEPPDDIGANFYPKLGPYSSYDRQVIEKHMEYCIQARIGVLSLSWYPFGMSDDEGKPMNKLVPTLLEIANKYGIKICFHIEPYKGRSASSVAADIKHLIEKYGYHPAFYTTTNHMRDSQRRLPLIYVYDSYLIPSHEWSSVLGRGMKSIRNTEFDAVVIGLLVEDKHKKEILSSGFDGFYTYFASLGFSYGSNVNHWKSLSQFASTNNLIFIPSVGPGYDDTNIRPWNEANTKERGDGRYYDFMWKEAIAVKPRLVSITSFNEWHEGTQIEPALDEKTVHVRYLLGRKISGEFTYKSYGGDPYWYLTRTRKWVNQFLRS